MIIKMSHDPGVGLLFIGPNRATVHALGFETMVAGGGNRLLETRRIVAAFNEPDIAPGFLFIETVQGMAGHQTGFAPGAFVEFDLKGVLFARNGFLERDEMFEKIGAPVVAIVFLRESRDGSLQLGLIVEELIDQVDLGKWIGRDHGGRMALGRKEILDLFAAGVFGEGFTRVSIFLIDLEEVFDEWGNVVERDSLENFARDGLSIINATAENDVVAFHLLSVFQFDRGAHHADVTDVVLGTRVMTAREMNVDRLVEFDLGLEVLGKNHRLSFGIGGSELTAGVAGAGDETS